MSAEGDALKEAANSLYSAIASGDDTVSGEEYQARYEALRAALGAYLDATDATLADHEARIAALEP